MEDPLDRYDIEGELDDIYLQDENEELEGEKSDAEELLNPDMIAEEADNIESVAGYKERQQATAGSRPQGDTFGALGGRLARAQRTPEEIALVQINVSLDSQELSFLKEGEKETIREKLQDYPRIEYYNVDMLVKATVYNERNATLNRKAFQSFAKQIGCVDDCQIDLVRYIRLLKSAPKK